MGPIQALSPTSFYNHFLVRPGTRVDLSNLDPQDTCGYEAKEETLPLLEHNKQRISELQHLLYAEGKKALLIVLQSMDAGGKDGVIRRVLSCTNPKGCQVTSFKAPTDGESKHDYLWRIHKHIPPKGSVGIFHRSQYEDVLVPRVKEFIPLSVCETRYKQINDFERMLSENGVQIIKFFLHMSRKEQMRRLIERIQRPEKRWKFSMSDLKERTHWDDYQRAYEEAITNCSTSWAPWFVIPADHKWFRNLVVSQIIVETLENMNPAYPERFIDMEELKE